MDFKRQLPRRVLFVPKNRFGPSGDQGYYLEMDSVTRRLTPSPLSISECRVAMSYLGGDKGLTETQVAISLPSYRSKGKIVTQGLPKGEIQQVLFYIGQVLQSGGDELGLVTSCRMPDGKKYDPMAGLAMCIALYAALKRLDIPEGYVFIGEVDLLRHVRGVDDKVLSDLKNDIAAGVLPLPLTVICPAGVAHRFAHEMDGMTVIGCERLEDVVAAVWPDIKK